MDIFFLFKLHSLPEYLVHSFLNEIPVTVLHSYDSIGSFLCRFDEAFVNKQSRSVHTGKHYHNIFPLFSAWALPTAKGCEQRPANITFDYLLRFTSSSSIESEVVIILALA